MIILYDPRVCHDLDLRSYLQSQMSQFTRKQNPCPGHNSSLPCWIWIIIHTIVFRNPRMYHDLDPRSYLQGQGHSAHITKIYVISITVLSCWILMIFYTNASCLELLVTLPRSRSQLTHRKNLFPGHNLLWVTWMGMILHTIVVNDTEVVVAGFFLSC